jgi:hypothetical protein
MNVQQLKKQIGKSLKLRPLPTRRDSDGLDIGPADDPWLLESVSNTPARVCLKNPATGHVLELESDNIRGYHSPEFLLLKCDVTITAKGISIEPHLPHAAVNDQQALVKSYVLPGGEYRYRVAVAGFPEDVRAFMTDSKKRFGAFTSAGVETAEWSQSGFVYQGRHAPEVLETLALKHSVQFTHSPAGN